MSGEKATKEVKKTKSKKGLIIALCIFGAVAIIAAVIVWYVNYQIPNSKYTKAKAFLEDKSFHSSEEYDKVYKELQKLDGFKDSKKLAEKCILLRDNPFYYYELDYYNRAKKLYDEGQIDEAYQYLNGVYRLEEGVNLKEKILSDDPAVQYRILNVGQEIYINLDNYTNMNRWIILEKKGNEYLILNLRRFKNGPYGKGPEATDWEHSEVRNWLNTSFIEYNFKNGRDEMIIPTTIENPNGKATTDKIFLLSLSEINKYYANFNAIYNTELFGDDKIMWVRNTCEDSRYAICLDGYNNAIEDEVNKLHYYQPAMWVDITKIK